MLIVNYPFTSTTGRGIFKSMKRAETVFWGLALAAGLYLLSGFNFSVINTVKNPKASAQAAIPLVQGALPAGGQSCGAKGGGCGCGGGGKINNPPGI